MCDFDPSLLHAGAIARFGVRRPLEETPGRSQPGSFEFRDADQELALRWLVAGLASGSPIDRSRKRMTSAGLEPGQGTWRLAEMAGEPTTTT